MNLNFEINSVEDLETYVIVAYNVLEDTEIERRFARSRYKFGTNTAFGVRCIGYISEELEKSVVDYIKTPNNLIESNQMITAMLCGLNENIKSQAFAKNNIVVNYCHYNSLYSAFLLSNRSKSTNKALVNYPKISTLQKIERSVSSEKLNQL